MTPSSTALISSTLRCSMDSSSDQIPEAIRSSRWPPSPIETLRYTTGTGAELEMKHLASTCPPEATTVPLWCKPATSGSYWLDHPPTETGCPLAATGGDECKCSPSEETAPEKPCGQITAATSELEVMEGVGTPLPPPGSDPVA